MGDPKFKVGDIVEILDGSKIKNYTGGWYGFMSRYVGKKAMITRVELFLNGVFGYRLSGCEPLVSWDERGLKPVTTSNCKKECIVIYRKDDEVVALNKATGETATARCNPVDTFDFNIGAKLAFERLMDTKEPVKQEERKPYNGKVVCISTSPGLSYTVGKIYEFKNGQTKLNHGLSFPSHPVFSFEEFAEICRAKCIEIVE